MPRAPASATAAASRGGERSPIPACWIGTVHPTNSVNFVLSIVSSLGRGICLVRLIGVTPRDHASTRERIETLEQGARKAFPTKQGRQPMPSENDDLHRIQLGHSPPRRKNLNLMNSYLVSWSRTSARLPRQAS